MRIAIITESFLPDVNGVSNSVAQIIHHRDSHELLVIAPGAGDSFYDGVPVVRVPRLRIEPFPVGLPIGVINTLKEFRPDMVHAASPFVLGAAGVFAAKRLGVPVVGVFQTDVAGFATRYRLGFLQRAAWRWLQLVHNNCARTLAPSTATIAALTERGFKNVCYWGRGVDTELFHPDKRTGSSGVGYVGRLAPEKGLYRLAGLPITIIGDGPMRAELEQLLPMARFLGELRGETLARELANLDVLIHPGEFETFCQTIQEAHASGVPVIAVNAGGPKDLVNPTTGLLIDAATFTTDLPQAIDYVLRHREEMGAAARASVADRTWDNVIAELFQHYYCVASG